VYEAHFGLLNKPFSFSPDASCFFMSKQHGLAIASMQYSMLSNAGMILISAESGCGKTLLVRRIASNLDDSVRMGFINNTHVDFGRVTPWILSAFELRASPTDEVEMQEVLRKFLDDMEDQQKRVVLVIDEAHNLSNGSLEELRLLLNENTSERRGIQLVLLGLPSLADKLRHKSMVMLSQRIALDVELEAFDFQTTYDYITFCLSLQGGKPELFDYVARSAVFYHSRGIPRLINSLCDLALVFGYGDSLDSIDYRVIDRVLLSKNVGLHYYASIERASEAVALHAAINETHGIDIARFSRH
jgi:type II secretory pathway predicted ATPase ExeA